MFIVIDRSRLCVLYKHENQTALVSLANLEIPEAAIVVMSATEHDSYERFTDYELKVLFENICGEKHTGYNRPFLIKSVAMLVGLLDVSEINPTEVEAQLESVGCTDEQFKYQPGSKVPSKQLELYAPKALVSTPGYVPTPKLYSVPKTRQTLFKLQTGVRPNPHLAAAFEAATQPSVPRVRSEGPSDRPAQGSKTGAVWDIADSCFLQHPTIDKILRKMVADACEQAGINGSTMSVQYSKWRTTKNI